MHFALCNAIARCQARRLRALGAGAPLPAAIVVLLVAIAPFVLWRIGGIVGEEFVGTADSREVATALVLGPCLAAAAAGAILTAALPTRSELGLQVAAGPVTDCSAVSAGLSFPLLLATPAVVPPLVCFCLALADRLPGGRPAGLALALAIVAAVPAGGLVAEGVQAVIGGWWPGLLALCAGIGAWWLTGVAMGAAPLGPLAPVALALRSSGPAGLTLIEVGFVAASLGAVWLVLAARRPEQRASARRRRHLEVIWRLPIVASVACLVFRRDDVRLATTVSISLGATGAVVAIAAGAEAPGPFLLATTTTVLGSVVAALAGWGVLAAGGWLWLASPRGRGSIATTVWNVGLVGAAVPAGLVATIAAFGSGASWHAGAVLATLVVVTTAIATLAGALVPWTGAGSGGQLSSFAAFVGVGIAASLLIGLTAPRLARFGLPDPAVAGLICGALAGLAGWSLLRRLERGAQ